MAGLLAGKKALVTGSASGIGAAIVAEFVAQGASVFGVDKNASAHQPSAQFDLSNVAGLPELVASAEKEIGEIDILVNCAGMAIGEVVTGFNVGGVRQNAPSQSSFASLLDEVPWREDGCSWIRAHRQHHKRPWSVQRRESNVLRCF